MTIRQDYDTTTNKELDPIFVILHKEKLMSEEHWYETVTVSSAQMNHT